MDLRNNLKFGWFRIIILDIDYCFKYDGTIFFGFVGIWGVVCFFIEGFYIVV